MMERTAHLTVSPARGAAAGRRRGGAAGARGGAGRRRGHGRPRGARAGAERPRGRVELPGAGSAAARRRPGPTACPRRGITRPLAARLHVAAGDLMRVTSSRTRLSPVGPIPVSVVLCRLRGAGRQRPGEIGRGRGLGGDRAPAARASRRAPSPSRRGLPTRRRPTRPPRSSARRCRRGIGSQTWRDLNAPLAFALRLEKAVIFVTVGLVIVVAALNIVVVDRPDGRREEAGPRRARPRWAPPRRAAAGST